MDNSLSMATLHRSKIGQDVKVIVAVPVIAKSPSTENQLSCGLVESDLHIPFTVSQQDVPYKHWINSSIPIIDQTYFGNYTLKYNMTDFVTITINAEGLSSFIVPRIMKELQT